MWTNSGLKAWDEGWAKLVQIWDRPGLGIETEIGLIWFRPGAEIRSGEWFFFLMS